MNSISIIIPAYNEENYIVECLESIVLSDRESLDIEVFVVDGCSSDATQDLVKEFMKKYNFVKLLVNEKKIAPTAMNLGIKASRGEYIFVISAHAKYSHDYFKVLVKYIKELDADCVGPVLVTQTKVDTPKANSIKEILSNKFGVGDASFRTGGDEVKSVDTVAFGCYKRDVFSKYGLYDERLVRNQDIELNKRIINGGGSIYLIPFVKAIYFARDNFKDLAKNNYENGKWNILTAYYTKTLGSLSLRHFVPLIFVLSLLMPTFLSIFVPKLVYLSIFSFISYLALVIIISLKVSTKQNSFVYLVSSFFVLHISYGLGSLNGIFVVMEKILKEKNE